MAKKTAKKTSSNGNGDFGFEQKLRPAADKLRGNMEPSDYKHIILGLVFLKYISDSFKAKYKALMNGRPSGHGDYWFTHHLSSYIN